MVHSKPDTQEAEVKGLPFEFEPKLSLSLSWGIYITRPSIKKNSNKEKINNKGEEIVMNQQYRGEEIVMRRDQQYNEELLSSLRR